MIDINTVETVEAEDYTVRVGHGEQGYEAVVLEEERQSGGFGGRGHPLMQGVMMVQMTRQTGPDQSNEEREPVGPVVEAPHRWVAIGLAIEAYEWPGDTVTTEEAYEQMTGRSPQDQVAELVADAELPFEEEVDVDADDIVDELEGDDE